MNEHEAKHLAERALRAVEHVAEALQCQAAAINRLSAALEGQTRATYPAPIGVRISVS